MENLNAENNKITLRIHGYLKEKVQNLENSDVSLIYFFIAFLFSVMIRNFLEAVLYPQFYDISAVFNLETITHFYSFYISLFLSVALLFYLILKKPIVKILKVVLPASVVLVIAPILDYTLRFFTGRTGVQMGYIQENNFYDVFMRYITYFGEFSGGELGITLGMKIEILLIIVLGFLFVLISNSSKIKSVLCAFLLYSLIFWLATAFPSVLNITFDSLGWNLNVSPIFITRVFLLLIALWGCVILYIHNKKFFISIIKDIRPYRLIHYELMFVLGVVLALKINDKDFQYPSQVLKFTLIIISIAFAWLFSVFVNNIEDLDIDNVSNKNRPLTSGDIQIKPYRKISWALLFSTILIAYSVDVVFLFFILTYIGVYYIYSTPPFRLKKIPLLSKSMIAFASLILIISGYWMINYSLKSFPAIVTVMIMVGFTLIINFIDIKDYEGDKAAGVKTLPGLIGLRKSKIMIGLSFIFTYLLVYFLLDEIYMLLPLALIGVLEFYLVNKEDFREGPVFTVYLSSLLFLIFIFMGI